MNSACLAQGSASMWAARDAYARTRHASTLQYRHPDWETREFPKRLLRADQVCLRQCRIAAQLGHRGGTTAELPAFSRNGPVFRCPNYEDPRAGIRTRYISIEQRLLIHV